MSILLLKVCTGFFAGITFISCGQQLESGENKLKIVLILLLLGVIALIALGWY